VRHTFDTEKEIAFRPPRERKLDRHGPDCKKQWHELPSCDAIAANDATRSLSIPSPRSDHNEQGAPIPDSYIAKCRLSHNRSGASRIAERPAERYMTSGKKTWRKSSAASHDRPRQHREASKYMRRPGMKNDGEHELSRIAINFVYQPRHLIQTSTTLSPSDSESTTRYHPNPAPATHAWFGQTITLSPIVNSLHSLLSPSHVKIPCS
jgi:hypothetical protein